MLPGISIFNSGDAPQRTSYRHRLQLLCKSLHFWRLPRCSVFPSVRNTPTTAEGFSTCIPNNHTA